MNTEEAFTPEQVTEVVGALHNATMDKWLGAGLTLVIGAVVIKIVMRALNRLVAKLPLDKAMLSFLTAAARIVMGSSCSSRMWRVSWMCRLPAWWRC